MQIASYIGIQMKMSKKINVLMMVSWYGPQGDHLVGGRFHYEQAKSLNKYCNCAIYTPYDRQIKNIFSSKIEWGIQTYRSKYKLENKIRNRLYQYLAMRKIVKEFHPNIIHGNVATEVGRAAIVLGKIFRIPVIMTEHSSVEASGVRSFPHYYYAKYVYGRSLANYCVSDKLTQELKKIFPKYNFCTMYNGITEPSGMELVRNRYRRDNCVNMAIVASFYDKSIKGFQYLLPAIANVRKNSGNICLHIVGGGEYLEYYKRIATELGIDDICVFYGNVLHEQVYKILFDMDFLISASLFESFGCTIAEGLMLGKPAVVTRSGGVESIISSENGILVERENERALELGILEMIDRYKSFSEEKLRKNALEKFSVEVISQKYVDVYKNILNLEEK